MKKCAILAFLLLLAAGQATGQLYRLENNQKLGVNALFYSQTSLEVTQISTNEKAVANESYNGGLFFYERVFRSQFGLTFGIGLIRRNVDARILSVDTSIEEEGLVIQISGRSYFDRHRKRGFNFQIGMDYGYTQLSSNFLVANDILDGEKTKASLSSYGLFSGFDWLFSNSGLRFNLGYMFGEAADNSSLDDVYVHYEFNTLYLQLGTFVFF